MSARPPAADAVHMSGAGRVRCPGGVCGGRTVVQRDDEHAGDRGDRDEQGRTSGHAMRRPPAPRRGPEHRWLRRVVCGARPGPWCR